MSGEDLRDVFSSYVISSSVRHKITGVARGNNSHKCTLVCPKSMKLVYFYTNSSSKCAASSQPMANGAILN